MCTLQSLFSHSHLDIDDSLSLSLVLFAVISPSLPCYSSTCISYSPFDVPLDMNSGMHIHYQGASLSPVRSVYIHFFLYRAGDNRNSIDSSLVYRCLRSTYLSLLVIYTRLNGSFGLWHDYENMEGKEEATNAEDAVVTHRCVMLEMKGRMSCLQHAHGKIVAREGSSFRRSSVSLPPTVHLPGRPYTKSGSN
jgi:hypothetical protein